MTPKISIIMPVYNAAAFLPKTLTALLGQTFPDIEVIAVNDGSKDESLALLKSYTQKDERLIVINQKNQGPAAARNVALERARGQYVMFCDADDWYEPQMCERMLQTIRQKDVDMVMCDTNVIDEKEGLDRGDSLAYYAVTGGGGVCVKEWKQMKKINVLLWSKIFRKSLIDKYKIRFPNGCLHDDDAFVFQYLLVTRKVFLLPEKLYNYFRREKDSIMANDYTYSSTSTDRCQIGHFCYEWMVKNHLFPARRNDFYRFYFSQFRICFIRLRPDLRSDCLENESLFLKTQVAYLKNRATDFKIHRKMMEIFKKEMLRIERRFSISSPESLWCLKKKFWTQLILCVCTLGLLRGFRKKVVRLQEKIQRMSVELTQEKK